MHLLPPICGESRHLWRTTAPLIHFWIALIHCPGRVARQFGRYQQTPPALQDTVESLHAMKNGSGKNWPEEHQAYLRYRRNLEDKCLCNQSLYDSSEHEEYMRWFSDASILYLQSPNGVLNTYSPAKSLRQIAASVVVADEETIAFACDLLHSCKEAIKDLLEPVNGDDIFAAFDSEQELPIVVPVHEDDPGPSSRLARMRR